MELVRYVKYLENLEVLRAIFDFEAMKAHDASMALKVQAYPITFKKSTRKHSKVKKIVRKVRLDERKIVT